MTDYEKQEVIALLESVLNDYQLDKEHSDYCGFLNMSIEDDERNGERIKIFVDNIEVTEKMANDMGLEVEKATYDETIIHLAKEDFQIPSLIQHTIDFATYVSNHQSLDDFWSMSKEAQLEAYEHFLKNA